MEDIIKEFIEVIKGLPPYLSFISLLIIFVLFTFKKSIKVFISKMKLPKIFRKFDIETLLFHDLFNVCDGIKQRVSIMDFTEDSSENCPTKTKMLRILIVRKMDVVKEEVTQFLEEDGIEDMESNEIKFRFKKSLNDLVQRYNDEAYKEYVKMGISHEDAWYFINRYEEYRGDIIEGFVDRLDSIASNNSYSSNYDKLTAILELCSLAMAIIPRDIRSVYLQLNGKFDKYNK